MSKPVKNKLNLDKYNKAKELGMGDFYLELEKARELLGLSEEDFGILGRKIAKEIDDTK